jgi:hypothetical protein
LWEFTKRTQEASEAVIEMHDDEPRLFEIMMQFFYNCHEDLTASKLCRIGSEEDQQKHLFLPVQLCGIADKYDAMPLQTWAVRVLQENLLGHDRNTYLSYAMYDRLAREYYRECPKPGTIIGNTLTRYVVEELITFIEDDLGDQLLRQLPTFAADVLLVIKPNIGKINRE